MDGLNLSKQLRVMRPSVDPETGALGKLLAEPVKEQLPVDP